MYVLDFLFVIFGLMRSVRVKIPKLLPTCCPLSSSGLVRSSRQGDDRTGARVAHLGLNIEFSSTAPPINKPESNTSGGHKNHQS